MIGPLVRLEIERLERERAITEMVDHTASAASVFPSRVPDGATTGLSALGVYGSGGATVSAWSYDSPGYLHIPAPEGA